MPYHSDDENETAPKETSPATDQSAQLLTLFNFYWLKFLSQKRVLDQERKMLEEEIVEIETEERIRSMRNTINDLSSS